MSDKSNLENIELKNRVDTLTLKEFETFLKIYETQVFNKKVSDINSYAEVDNDILEKFFKKYSEILKNKYNKHNKEHLVCVNFKTIFEIISNNFKLEKIIPSPENLNQQISFIMEKTFDEKKLINDIEQNDLNFNNDIKNKVIDFINAKTNFLYISKFLNNLSITKEISFSKQANTRKMLKDNMIKLNLELQETLDKSSNKYHKSVELDKKLKGYNELSDLELNIELH